MEDAGFTWPGKRRAAKGRSRACTRESWGISIGLPSFNSPTIPRILLTNLPRENMIDHCSVGSWMQEREAKGPRKAHRSVRQAERNFGERALSCAFGSFRRHGCRGIALFVKGERETNESSRHRQWRQRACPCMEALAVAEDKRAFLRARQRRHLRNGAVP